MNTELYLAFVVAAALLIVSPGPTVLLVTSTSLQQGRRSGLVAVAGSTLAAAIQLAVVVSGLASIAALAGQWFELIRWAGVAYLVYLGLSAWLGRPEADGVEAAPTTGSRRHFARGFVVTMTNPKTLLFHGAFLPQFVDPALPELPQMAALAVSFVVIAGLGDSLWALLAARVGARLRNAAARRWTERLSGSILIAAAILLASIRRADRG